MSRSLGIPWHKCSKPLKLLYLSRKSLMRLEEVLGYIPKEELNKLSIEYKVAHQVKKLHGQTMFQLPLFQC